MDKGQIVDGKVIFIYEDFLSTEDEEYVHDNGTTEVPFSFEIYDIDESPKEEELDMFEEYNEPNNGLVVVLISFLIAEIITPYIKDDIFYFFLYVSFNILFVHTDEKVVKVREKTILENEEEKRYFSEIYNVEVHWFYFF